MAVVVVVVADYDDPFPCYYGFMDRLCNLVVVVVMHGSCT